MGAQTTLVEELLALAVKATMQHQKHCYCGLCKARTSIAEYVKSGHHKRVSEATPVVHRTEPAQLGASLDVSPSGKD